MYSTLILKDSGVEQNMGDVSFLKFGLANVGSKKIHSPVIVESESLIVISFLTSGKWQRISINQKAAQLV